MDWVHRITKRLQAAASMAPDLQTLQRKVEEHLSTFSDVMRRDWRRASVTERDAAADRIRSHVLNELVPAAGTLSLAGAPGILVYTPCQIAGAVAIAHVYQGDKSPGIPSWLTVAGVMLWGKAGQVTWIVLSDVFKPILSPPVAGLAVIPYVRQWTGTALNQVSRHYRAELMKAEPHLSAIDTPGLSELESTEMIAAAMRDQVTVGIGTLRAEETANSVTVREAKRMRDHLFAGGTIFFDEQKRVFRAVVEGEGQESARALGSTHVFRGVAGSGKTVILAQLVPHLAASFHQQYGRWPQILVYHHNNYLRKLLESEIRRAINAPIDLDAAPLAVAGRVRVRDVYSLPKDLRELGALDEASARGHDRGSAITSEEMGKQLLPCVRQPVFDIIMVDEGQDITRFEYRFLTELAKQDGKTGRPSFYVFFDEIQNIHGQSLTVLERLQGHPDVRHFLDRCVRTPKRIVEFAVNVCLTASAQVETRKQIADALGVNELLSNGLVTPRTRHGSDWLDCDFCVFPGDDVPIVHTFASNAECFAAIGRDLVRLQAIPQFTTAFQSGVLVICPSKASVRALYSALAPQLGGLLHLRSGERSEVSRDVKLNTLAVESGINLAVIQDAKGYDADLVIVVNPDGTRAEDVQKLAQFYVACTRSKQYLVIYSSIPEHAAPIHSVARKVASTMQDTEPDA